MYSLHFTVSKQSSSKTDFLFVIVAFEDVDLNLRISQPNLHYPKRDGNSGGTNFSCHSFEAMETGNSQVDSHPPFPLFGIFRHIKKKVFIAPVAISIFF